MKQCALDTTLLVADKKKYTFTPVDKEGSVVDEERSLDKSGDDSLDRIIEDAHEQAAEKSEDSAMSQLIPERVSTDPDSSDNSSDSEEKLIVKREVGPKQARYVEWHEPEEGTEEHEKLTEDQYDNMEERTGKQQRYKEW